LKNNEKSSQKLKIGICGTRGIPACYGGFETFAEELGARLVERGHEVTVYGRKHVIDYEGDEWRGIKLKLLPSLRTKYLETVSHTFLSLVDAARRRFDVILVCNAANSPFVWIPRLFGTPVAVNVDGVERLRSKWSAVGRLWYRLGEWCSVKFASRIVADADVIRDYYEQEYKADSTVIAYGFWDGAHKAVVEKARGDKPGFSELISSSIIQDLGLESGSYLLYVSRLEPENNSLLVVEAYNSLSESMRKMPLVIVGDAPYADAYKARVMEIAGDSVVFTGFQFGDSYRALQLGAYLYIQATEVGGTHPALVESMGFANCIIANDTPEHREVLGDAGSYYEKNSLKDLSRLMEELISDEKRVKSCREAAYKRVCERYRWAEIVSRYERLFWSLQGA